MNIEMDCPSCPGRLAFAARRSGRGGRLVGSCGGCGSVFSLFGGRVAPIDPALPNREVQPWRFGSLVARERRAALGFGDGASAAAAD